MRIQVYATLAIALAIVSCAQNPARTVLRIAPPDLQRLVSGSSLLMLRTKAWPYQTMLYLDPDGTGWFDGKLIAGTPPEPVDMAMILSWKVTDTSELCAWVSPLIGEMPGHTPPHRECLTITGFGTIPETFEASTTRELSTVTAPLELTVGNAFPASRTKQYLLQVGVLFGGNVPRWNIP